MTNIPAWASRAVRRAKASLAQRLKVNQREITLQKVLPMTWSDTSLGWPEPDRVYAQALTPGYVVLLSCGQDTYEYRTDAKGQILVYIGKISN
jgi:peptidoglycan/xylan/chitin deacetylase (PgdA/CDA1 family)